MTDLEDPNPGVWKAPARKEPTPEQFNKHVIVPNRPNPSLLAALTHFAGGEVDPAELDLLLSAVNSDKLKDAAEEFEIQTGRDSRLYLRKLTAMALPRNRPPEKPPAPDAFERHSINLPCGDRIHYSNIEVVTTCLKCGSKFSFLELVPALAKLLKDNPDLSDNSTHARSRMDIFQGLRGK